MIKCFQESKKTINSLAGGEDMMPVKYMMCMEGTLSKYGVRPFVMVGEEKRRIGPTPATITNKKLSGEDDRMKSYAGFDGCLMFYLILCLYSACTRTLTWASALYILR